MLIFFDTEFSDLSIDPRLISIGLVSEDGREFYAELSGNENLSNANEFVLEEVIPKLQGGESVMTMRELSNGLVEWLMAFGVPVQFATDSLRWDWPWIETIFADFGVYLLEDSAVWQDIKNHPHRLAGVARPANVDGRPLLLPQSPEFHLAVDQAFERGLLRRHHALDDAKANRLAWMNSQK